MLQGGIPGGRAELFDLDRFVRNCTQSQSSQLLNFVLLFILFFSHQGDAINMYVIGGISEKKTEP